jgi:hypothetical protein
VQAGGGQQRVGDHGLPALGAGAGELRHQGVDVAVHDQAGQAVGLAVDQAHASLAIGSRARMATPGDAALEEGRVDALASSKLQARSRICDWG